jgi:NADPH2:quinone reductase
MRVIEVRTPGGPEVLELAERPDPVAGPGQAVVRIAAANINPTDLGVRIGRFAREPLPPPYIPGWDFAGTVTQLGPGVTELAAGDRVVGMLHWYELRGAAGAYAEQIAAELDWLVPLPDGLDEAVAATIPLNALTADQGLELLGLAPGSTLLVTGASGGVGSFAVQLAAQAGHHVIALAGRDDEDWPPELGAAQTLPRDTDLATIPQVDALFDAVPIGEDAARAVRDGGAIVTIRGTDTFDPGRGITKQRFLIHHDRARLRELVDDVASGRLKTRVAHRLALADAPEGHRLVEAGGLRGKVVLVP